MGKKVTLPTGQYQVIGKCYMPPTPGQFPTLYDPANSRDPIIVYFDGLPGPHLRPLDQNAHNNMALYNQHAAERERQKQNPQQHSLRSITDIPQHRMPPVLMVPASEQASPPPPPPPPQPTVSTLADMLDDGTGPQAPKNKGGRKPGSGGRPRGRPKKGA